MKVLWFTTESTRYSSSSVACYGSSGLIDALQDKLAEEDSIELGMAFLYTSKAGKEKRGKVTYYPMYQRSKSFLQKLYYYWFGYKRENYNTLLSNMLRIIDDYRPDVIQVFGIESPFACLLGHTDVPVAVHLQGFFNPYSNAFYPQGMNRYTFLFRSFSIQEWLLRNGNNFAARLILLRSRMERDYFRRMQFAMGRTDWDHMIARVLSPDSRYFHVGEMLREEFVQSEPWKLLPRDKFILVSTISQTVAKGLDVILKTARMFAEYSDVQLEWHVIGVEGNSKFVRFFENHCGIKSEDVHVRYAGICNAAQICNLLLAAHVYIHPSYIDNSPNSLCEAQYLGLPVIGTYVGGVPSLITHQGNGLLVPANAPYELTYHLQYLYRHPEAMLQLGSAARDTALVRHSKEKIAADLMNVYQQITSR